MTWEDKLFLLSIFNVSCIGEVDVNVRASYVNVDAMKYFNAYYIDYSKF